MATSVDLEFKQLNLLLYTFMLSDFIPEVFPAGPCSVSSTVRSSFRVCRAARSRQAAARRLTSRPAGRGTPPRTRAAVWRCPSPLPDRETNRSHSETGML